MHQKISVGIALNTNAKNFNDCLIGENVNCIVSKLVWREQEKIKKKEITNKMLETFVHKMFNFRLTQYG